MHFSALLRWYLSTVFALLLRSALAGGTVNNCTETDLQIAMAGGGTVLFACDGTITLSGTITVSQKTVLDANGRSVVISGGQSVRLFQVNNGVSFSVNGLTLANGAYAGANGVNADPAPPGGDGFGACIYNQSGLVSLSSCTITNHLVRGGNAGQDVTNNSFNNAKGGRALGAAIFSIGGGVNLTNCLIANNSSTGGMGSAPVMSNAGDAGEAYGGAIYLEQATANLESVVLTNNLATGGPCQLVDSLFGPLTAGGDALGGAIAVSNSTVVAHNCSVLSNTATGGGSPSGALVSSSDPGAGSAYGGGVFVSGSSMADLRLCSVYNNSANGGNGLRYGHAGAARGGGVCCLGSLSLRDSTLSANSTIGGSVSVTPGLGLGGGCYSSGELILNASTFDHNLAKGGSAVLGTPAIWPGQDGRGGGLWNSGTLAVTNATFAANRALGGNAGGGPGGSNQPGGAGSGGGLFAAGPSKFLVNVTVAENRADGGNGYPTANVVGPSHGGGVANTNGTLLVLNSIIANSPNGGDVWGPVLDAGYNICSDGTANFSATGSLNQADPGLSALTTNGGPTATMALLVGSLARDAIPTNFPPVDQRGVSRPQGAQADIGAFEAGYIASGPSFVVQPTGGVVRAGTNFTFNAAASGTPPIAYQWRKNGNPVTGATMTSLILTNVQAADAGTYSLFATNSAGTALSDGAVLSVDSYPRILADPASVTVSPGAATNFTVVADGPALSYQWFHDNLPIASGTSSTLNIPDAEAGAQGSYFVSVSNFSGSVTSQPATLSFDSSALSIVVQPKDQTIEIGYPATFKVVASGIPTLLYQWEKDSVLIPGATASTFTIQSVQTNDAAGYSVIITNDYRSVTSVIAHLTTRPGAIPPMLIPSLAGSNFVITFNVETGRSYRLLFSSNLSVWSPVATNLALTAGPIQFLRPTSPARYGFYRVVTP